MAISVETRQFSHYYLALIIVILVKNNGISPKRFNGSAPVYLTRVTPVLQLVEQRSDRKRASMLRSRKLDCHHFILFTSLLTVLVHIIVFFAIQRIVCNANFELVKSLKNQIIDKIDQRLHVITRLSFGVNRGRRGTGAYRGGRPPSAC